MLPLSNARHPQYTCLLFHLNMAGIGGWRLLQQYFRLPSYKEVHFLITKHLDYRRITTLSSLCRDRLKGYL